jgi:PPOX class probable F420-dependent enzyme
VRPDGTPHLVPTWFAWDGEAITIVSKAGAQKVRNLRANRSAMLALGDAEDDFDVGLIEAVAELADEPTPLTLPTAFRAKYAERIAELGLTPAQFARTYPQLIRLTPIKSLGWHGRSTPVSVMQAAGVVASQRITSIAEPIRIAVRGLFGEPMGRSVPAI